MHYDLSEWWKILLVMTLLILGALMLLIGLLIRSPVNRWGQVFRRLGSASLGTGLAGWWIITHS